MSNICLVCVKNNKANASSSGSIRARVTLSSCATTNFKSASNIRLSTQNITSSQSKISGQGSLRVKKNIKHGIFALSDGGVFNIKGKIKTNNSIRVDFDSISNIKLSKVDKFAGPINLNNIKKIYNNPIINNDTVTELFGFGESAYFGNTSTITPTYYSSPVKINNDAWSSIACGWFNHSVAIRNDGKLFTWGENIFGELGDGTTISKFYPAQIGNDFWSTAACGLYHSLAIRNDGKLFSWGFNEFGQLGTGDTNDKLIPTQVGNDSWIAISAGWKHSAGIRNDGKLFIWGWPLWSQSIGSQSSTPTQIGNDSWIAVSCGRGHVLAIRNDGKLFALGLNTYCQLGDGTSTHRASLVQIGSDSWKNISCGDDFSCAIRADNTLFCWGRNEFGQLGITPSYRVCLPTQTVAGKFKKVFCGPSNVFAITTDNEIKCWGDNQYGQLGLGYKSAYELPTTFIKKYNIRTIAQSAINSFIIGNLEEANLETSRIEKLYPLKDIITSYDNKYFVDKLLNTTNLYSNIDEGIFIGNYTENGKSSSLISDDRNTYIQPSSIFTSGQFRYKFEVTKPYSVKESFLFIRATAPLYNNDSRTSPEYTISNIKLEDPSGNLIIQYKDIIIRGDADYNTDYVNFTTYISEPLVNNLTSNTWDEKYPLMYFSSGYSLNLDVSVRSLDDAFSEHFDDGYEESPALKALRDTNKNNYLSLSSSPISTHGQSISINPTNSLRISAIEICNSGGVGVLLDNYLSFYSEVDATGQRIIRSIYPQNIIVSSEDLNIYPSVSSVWESSPDGFNNIADNTTVSGSKVLASKLQDDYFYNYIKLVSNDPSDDSGRLTLKFSHQPPQFTISLTGGAFSFGESSKDFDTSAYQKISEADTFFVIEDISLKIIAKKAIGSRDYALDIIGYSDDKILNISPKVGAFLQNTEHGEGIIPSVSGFITIDDLGIATQAFSDKNQYYNSSLITQEAGDHYRLPSTPVVTGTTFAEYNIPLTIYKDNVKLGQPIDYSMSSYFENLYLDIYSLPSGATISTVQLIVTYKPSNGLNLHTLAQPLSHNLEKRNIKIYPIARNSNDTIINSDINDGPLSLIEDLPHAYKTPSSIKTNYSRRWRGVDGSVVSGPYDPNMFSVGFENPPLETPFLQGYFTFNYDSGNNIISNPINGYEPISGLLVGNYNKVSNLGLRFNNNSLFDDLTSYTTIDWTSISGYENHELYGKILDSYDNVIRVSGSSCHINFGNIDTASGFTVYTRFSPDINISGVDYNLFDSGVLFSKWDSDKNLEFVCGYENGFLCAYARSNSDDIIKITDTIPYSDYQYPLSVILTYNDNLSNKLRLYTNNEIDNELFNTLRASSESFDLSHGESDLVVGYSQGSGVGINAFISEIGISTYGVSGTNVVYNSPNRLYRQQTAEAFILGQRHIFDNTVNANAGDKFPLWDYVNEDTSLWNLGQFKYYNFSADFSRFVKRDGIDFIEHWLKHTGSGYTDITNLTLPSSIYNSGLSYHTQIENDFLRFNLSDVSDNSGFYSTYPRISKNLPRGYYFSEKSLVVETIIEHETLDNIIWPDNNIGPKLIVSLYSQNQDPANRPSKVNWGLINRSIHYLNTSGIYRLDSTFNPNDLLDTSEPWANFDLSIIKSEMDSKYYSKDINDMFLQYDLAYPSGTPFDSKIKIHSSHIRLENALMKEQTVHDDLYLSCSGDLSARSELDMFTYGKDILQDQHTLFVLAGSVPNSQESMSIYCSGANVSYATLKLYGQNAGYESASMPIYVGGRFDQFGDGILSLITKNLSSDQSASGTLSLFTKNIISITPYDDSLNLCIIARQVLVDFYPTSSMTLVTYATPDLIIENSSLNLFIEGVGLLETQNSNLNLFTINYPAYNQSLTAQNTITWNNTNVGKDIDTSDNSRSFLEANDEIRGVDIICYGTCDGTKPCVENALVSHEVLWYNTDNCLDGGIFRAKNTYTNLEASGFKTDVGYSGHFYGIRKYDGLIPNAPYDVFIEAKTGSNESVILPTEFNEVEYGSNDQVNYSGIKLTSPDRQVGDKYGYSVAIKNNIMAVGAPKHNLVYQENSIDYQLEDAGAVYVYKREDRPEGYDWPSNKHKSPWILDTKLVLPSGLIKDYYTTETTFAISGVELPLPITKRYWKVGQQGRQFGHSLGLAATDSGPPSFGEDSRQILVVGGPTAKWTSSVSGVGENAVLTNDRDFEEFNVSGVAVGLMVFTDEFVPEITIGYDKEKRKVIQRTYIDIVENLRTKDLIFQFFSDPPVKFNTKIIICQPIADNSTRKIINSFPEPQPSFITTGTIARNQNVLNAEQQTQKILSGIIDNFHAAFPYDNTKLNNNIPSLLGIYVDNSLSLGRSALSPAIDNFIKYYQEYSFASGLTDFYNIRSSGQCVEYTHAVNSSGNIENWIDMTNTILNTVLDTGRLIKDNDVRFFSSGIGLEYFNQELSMFNFPPESGGKVYIFEKESGNWNLIQQISSPNITYQTPDRFGHAVAISDNTEIIAVGSPYINSTCNIYEYKSSEKDRLYSSLPSWLSHKSSSTGGVGFYANILSDFSNWVNNYGYDYAIKILYSKLSPTDKYEAREYLGIEEYQNIYSYGEQSLAGKIKNHNWGFVLEKFIPTSRLGYSAAVNDDGSIVAFGAPTDSLNKWDDLDIYYKNLGYSNKLDTRLDRSTIPPTWSSNVNAGAVRLFESRKYYPHNKVIEYGKFGNLQKSLNSPIDSGHFNYLSVIFKDRNFTTTQFSDVNIPQDAGLVFIITPEIDALSDEVTDNIINWLSLGDRNLVLVGNDPVWESSGIYAKSNEIINKILFRLDSRMKLVPARNEYEAIVSGCSKALPCILPSEATPSYINPLEVNIYGVADIRMNLDNVPQWSGLYIPMPCSSTITTEDPITGEEKTEELFPNDKCELPLKNGGDLRAQFKVPCIIPDKPVTSFWDVNWPYLFKTFTPNCGEEDKLFGAGDRLDLSNQEPVPLLAAGAIVNETLIIPAKPATSGVRDIVEEIIIDEPSGIVIFDYDNIASSSIFAWGSENNNYTDLISNINSSNSPNLFYKPDIFEDRQSLLQANAIPQFGGVESTVDVVIEQAAYCVEEIYSSTSSKIIAIANVVTELEDFVYYAYDNNSNFYTNLVHKSINEKSTIAQLGGWTGRTSFIDGYEKSILYDLFVNNGNIVKLNVKKLYNDDDICWIANPSSLPSKEDIINIKFWLNTGNKKLIITHDSTDSQLRIVNKILSLLGSSIESYYNADEGIFMPVDLGGIFVNPNHPIYTGYKNNVKYSIKEFDLGKGGILNYVPFVNKDNITNICFGQVGRKIINNQYTGYWSLDTGVTKVTFPAIAGSGYRLFIDTVSETNSEIEPLTLYIENVSKFPDLPYPTRNTQKSLEKLKNYNVNYHIKHEAGNYVQNSINTKIFDVQVIDGASGIDIYILNETPRLNINTVDFIPKTVRLYGISGVALPIKNTTISNTTIKTIARTESYINDDAKPEVTINTSRFTYVSNINTPYCDGGEVCEKNGLSNKLIADGPVVAAQEEEHITSFSAGSTRSRITLLSDSSLVQGYCMGGDNFQVSENTVSFIASLYPSVNFSSLNSGRQFNILTKIISPERGSAAKYFASNNNSGINMLFGGTIGQHSQSSLSALTDSDSQYDPRYVKKPVPLPWEGSENLTEARIEALKKVQIQLFNLNQYLAGTTSKFSGIIEGKMYQDAKFGGGMPQIMIDTNHDYLDFERFPSGYPGDLFGYSIALYKNKLIVGSPFSAFSQEDVNPWSYYINGGTNSGIKVSYNGGAGSVYIFEKTLKGSGLHETLTPWEFTQKLRPESINIGQDLASSEESQELVKLGINSYSDEYLLNNSIIGDKFGSDVDIDGDIIIVGAPGHDFDNYYVNGTGNFIRKEFNSEFNIPSRTIYELGSSGSRNSLQNSGLSVLNNGAVFTFENRIIDWSNKSKKWKLVEKIIPQGYSAKNQAQQNPELPLSSGSENSNFGYSVSIDKANRSDADYSIAIGSHTHIHPSSVDGEILLNAGAAYSNDIMLRNPAPSIPSPYAYIDAKVFGEKGLPSINILVQNNNENNAIYYSSGTIYSDSKGQIFIEASGQNPSNRSFIQHIPYIVSVDGKYAYGLPESSGMILFINGKQDSSQNMNIFTNVDNSALVYNNIGLYSSSILGFASGIPSGLILYTNCPDPTVISESGLSLYMASGIGQFTDNLNLRIRGR